MHVGFNNWELGTGDLSLSPTNLWRGEGIDWWATTSPFQVCGAGVAAAAAAALPLASLHFLLCCTA